MLDGKSVAYTSIEGLYIITFCIFEPCLFRRKHKCEFSAKTTLFTYSYIESFTSNTRAFLPTFVCICLKIIFHFFRASNIRMNLKPCHLKGIYKYDSKKSYTISIAVEGLISASFSKHTQSRFGMEKKRKNEKGKKEHCRILIYVLCREKGHNGCSAFSIQWRSFPRKTVSSCL